MLEITTQEWKANGIVSNINQEFDSALPGIIETIGNAPALFFIDPFGPTHVHFSHLQPILTRNQRITELIINFDQDGLRRILDAASSQNINPKAAVTNLQNITKIIGSENWKLTALNKGLSSSECEMILLHEYMNNIAAYGYDVVAYPIRESLDTKPKYHFVYCTRHSDGIELMNDFIREEEDLLYGEHVVERLSLFPLSSLADEEVELRRKKLRVLMVEYLENQRKVTRKQTVKNLIAHNFGYFHGKDYRTVFGELITAGKLSTTDDRTKIDDRIYHFSSNE